MTRLLAPPASVQPRSRNHRRGVATAAPRRRLTAAEFFRLPLSSEERWELVKGELVWAASPFLPHQRIQRRLLVRLENWLTRHPVAEVIHDWDVKFLLDETRRLDLVVVLKEGSRLRLDGHGEGAPDFVIEVLSPGEERRDLGDKKTLYERCSVREYWVVDYGKRRLHQFLPGADGRYVERVLSRGAVRSAVLPGFSLRLGDLFRVLE